MYKRSEAFFSGYQETKLFYQVWEKPEPKGHIIITHGQGEHSDCYHRLVDYFKNESWNFYGWDLRGHGKSEGRRGYAHHFDDYCRDYFLFLKNILKDRRLQKGPIILLSHSMGGLIQAKTLIENREIIPQATIYSAPLFGVAVQVPAVKEQGAKVLNLLWPTLTLGNEISNDNLTRDPSIIREFEQDTLRHGRISSGVYLGMQQAFDFVLPRAHEIRFPTLIQISQTDPVVSYQKAREFFTGLSSPLKRLVTYDKDARHELYNDTIRNEVFAELKGFIDQFS